MRLLLSTPAVDRFLTLGPEALLTILAIVLGPILALWIQRISDRRREARQRRYFVFKELMATRAAKTSPRHVDALNSIEMEFSGQHRSDKKVTDAWRLYLDHLGDTPALEDEPAMRQWSQKTDELLTDLLYEMSGALRRNFDRLTLKKGIYQPRAFGEIESEQVLLRRLLVDVMAGKRVIRTEIVTPSAPASPNGHRDDA